MRKQNLVSLYLYLWLIGALVSLGIQLFFPIQFAQTTLWTASPGWQREISIWNFGIIILIILSIRSKNSLYMRNVSLVLIILSFCFCINHINSFLIDTKASGNFIGFLANFASFLFGSMSLIATREKKI